MSIEVFPVVHVHGSAQALEQAQVAHEAGADGVYLIDPDETVDTKPLTKAFNHVTIELPDFFVGLNFTQIDSGFYSFSRVKRLVESGEMTRLPNGIWTDDVTRQRAELSWARALDRELMGISYLGGVAFKYTLDHTEDPLRAAEEARKHMGYVNVVTTSGPGTGVAPNPEKIKAMKNAIGRKRLAIASGVSVENIHEYAGNVDQVLVSSSLETGMYSGIFVPERVLELIQVAKEL